MIFNPEKTLEQLNKKISAASFGSEPLELYEPIRYFMQLGGKRLRPLLTVFGTHLFSDDTEAAIMPAIGVEVFHNFTLMHDDIMDKAPLRRNQQTVHEKWDQSVAILAGDVMLVKAYEYLLKADKDLYPEILKSFNKCAIEVCEGQQLDVNFEAKETVTEAEYLHMIRLKTAVLLGFAAKIGAMIGGADPENQTLLQKAAESMGIAFQLKDDLLDVYGDQKKFGKQVGGDIVSNKKTFLLIKALEKADSTQLRTLKGLLDDKEISAEHKVKKVTDIYDQLGIRAETETMINAYIEQALKDISKVNAPLYRKAQLKNYFLKLAQRES